MDSTLVQFLAGAGEFCTDAKYLVLVSAVNQIAPDRTFDCLLHADHFNHSGVQKVGDNTVRYSSTLAGVGLH